MPVDTTRLTDADWIDAVMRRMLALDEGLGDDDLREFVGDLAARPQWRAMAPEAAAAKAFEEIEPPEGGPA